MNIGTKLQTVVAIASALASLLPAIDAAVKGAESALGTGAGAAKLAVVSSTIEAAYATVQGVEVTWSQIQPAVVGVVNALVAQYNLLKTFSHGGSAPTPKPA